MKALITLENNIHLLHIKDLLRIANYKTDLSNYKEEYIKFTFIEGSIVTSFFTYTSKHIYKDTSKYSIALPFTDKYLIKVVNEQLITIYRIASSIVADSNSKPERIEQLRATLGLSLYMFKVLQTYIREYNEII